METIFFRKLRSKLGKRICPNVYLINILEQLFWASKFSGPKKPQKIIKQIQPWGHFQSKSYAM